MTELIRTPFGFDSTALEVVRGVDLAGRRAIVTGGSSGLGIETARALASAGAEVTLAVRDPDAGRRTAAHLVASTGNPHVGVEELDLSDRRSVSRCVARWRGPLHILVGNAGVMALPERRTTPEGWEMHLAVNHLGHHALAVGLHDALAVADDARIVIVSSRGHRRSALRFDDPHFTVGDYEPLAAYGQSKTANILFAAEATRRWADDRISANAVLPGAIADTKLMRHLDPAILASLIEHGTYRFKTREQGAATTVLAATWPGLRGIGGRVFEDGNEVGPADPDDHAEDGEGIVAHALDPVAAQRLWELSERLLAA
jgi:NAD(P)-dependent dehydrogenase (short-subunit alcohol dehydrogenase family)